MQTYWRDVTKWDWDLSQAKGWFMGQMLIPLHAGCLPLDLYKPESIPFHNGPASRNTYSFRMHYLIAEAALNNWTTGTTADAAYAAAITASMNQMNSYSGLLPSQKIGATEITDYIAANPLGTGAAAKQRLAEEMWVSLYMNPTEAWSNVRRMNLNLRQTLQPPDACKVCLP